MAFHSKFPKTKFEVQDVNSPFSFNQILISSSLWTRKWVKNTRNQTACESGVWTSRIARKFMGRPFHREELLLNK